MGNIYLSGEKNKEIILNNKKNKKKNVKQKGLCLSLSGISFTFSFFKVSEKFSENLHIIANEPSLAFFRIQEHVRKSLPQLVEQKVSSYTFIQIIKR